VGEIIEPIKIVFMGAVTGSTLEPLLIIIALMFCSASLQHDSRTLTAM
jgi:Ca2+/Na+ antiporter